MEIHTPSCTRLTILKYKEVLQTTDGSLPNPDLEAAAIAHILRSSDETDKESYIYTHHQTSFIKQSIHNTHHQEDKTA